MKKNRFIELLEAKSGNVKPLLNEYYAQKFDYKTTGQVNPYSNMVTVDKTKGTLTLNIKVDFENQGDGNQPEMRLQKGVTFRKMTNGTLVSSNQNYQLVTDLDGQDRGSGTGTITYYCKTNNLDIKGRTDIYKEYNLFWNEDWPNVERAFKDLCAAPMPKPTTPTLPTNQCDEYKARLQNPVQANAGDIQSFLKNLGYKITVDYSFGPGTAAAVGTFLYGAAAGINTVPLLHAKLVAGNKLPQGDVPGFGPKMAQAVANELNRVIKIKANCVSKK